MRLVDDAGQIAALRDLLDHLDQGVGDGHSSTSSRRVETGQIWRDVLCKFATFLANWISLAHSFTHFVEQIPTRNSGWIIPNTHHLPNFQSENHQVSGLDTFVCLICSNCAIKLSAWKQASAMTYQSKCAKNWCFFVLSGSAWFFLVSNAPLRVETQAGPWPDPGPPPGPGNRSSPRWVRGAEWPPKRARRDLARYEARRGVRLGAGPEAVHRSEEEATVRRPSSFCINQRLKKHPYVQFA